MKSGEITKCAGCDKGVMHTGLPLFYQVQIQRHGIKMDEVQRVHGMEQFMGGHVAIARVFHDPDITQPMSDLVKATICEDCSTKPLILAMILERAADRAEEVATGETQT